ncbi:MAG: GNAT family N-acetyltransferase [Pyrinomonadaceae bacterium]
MMLQLHTQPTIGQCVALRNRAGSDASQALLDANTQEVLAFLALRPVHTVVMTSLIRDNGLVSDLNRGKFFGCRDAEGILEGVALIGHSTLIEARSERALRSLALAARSSETPIHLVMSSEDHATRFWDIAGNGQAPRLSCVENLFEAAFPFPVKQANQLRKARPNEILQVAEAQAEVAFIESGVDPLVRDREGFLSRVARRIEQGRVYVKFDGDTLVFKADVIAITDQTAYLEGIYTAPAYRGQGIGPRCLSNLTVDLLSDVSNVCMLSNENFDSAHRSFERAGYRQTGKCTTLFV